MGLSHANARSLLWDAFVGRFGRDPTLGEIQFLQAVGLAEGGYGYAWQPPGQCMGSHNWGAIQHPDTQRLKRGEISECPPGSCPNADADSGGPYPACFKTYPSDEAGARGLVYEVYDRRPSVMRAANSGSLRAVATAMYDTKYFTGRHDTRSENIKWYEVYIARHLGFVRDALDEPSAFAPSASQMATGVWALGFVGVGIWAFAKVAKRKT